MSIGPPFQHPGSPPARPEVPEGVTPAPLPPPVPPAPAGGDGPATFPAWAPFGAMLVALLAAVVGVGVISIFVEAAGRPIDTGDLPTGITVGGTLLQDLALIGAAVLFAGVGGRKPTPWDFGLRRTPFWSAAGWALAAFVAFYAFAFVWAVALGISENDDLAEQLGAEDSTLNLVVVTVLVTVVAPLTEEFFFRGFTFPALAGWLGFIPGALITGIIFGLIHAGGTKAEFLVPLAVFGFLLCVLYRRTGSILPCIALHSANNSIALGVTLGWRWWQVVLAIALAPAAVLAIGLAFAPRRPPVPPAYAPAAA